MGDRRLTTKARDKRIAMETRDATNDGYGHPTVAVDWREVTRPWANVAFTGGSEQREAAQQAGSQTATFAVLADSDTAIVGVRDRIRYPLSDPDPAKWPTWEIQAKAEIGFNEGFAFTATRVAA